MGTTLITSLYNESKPARIAELLYCLNHNLNNPNIDNLCVVYDKYEQGKDNPIRAFIDNHKQINIEHCTGKPTFNQLFAIANELYAGDLILIANSDIHYDDSLALIEDIEFEKTLISLSRYNKSKEGDWTLITLDSGLPNYFSFDTWIFKSPFLTELNLEFELGSMFCDSFLARQLFSNSDYKVYNPCYSIKSFHIQEEISLSQLNSSDEKHKSVNSKIWRKEYLRNFFSSPISGVIWSDLKNMYTRLDNEVIWRSLANIFLILENINDFHSICYAAKLAEQCNKNLWIIPKSPENLDSMQHIVLSTQVNYLAKIPQDLEAHEILLSAENIKEQLSLYHEENILLITNPPKHPSPSATILKTTRGAKIAVQHYTTSEDLSDWDVSKLKYSSEDFFYFSHNSSAIDQENLRFIEQQLDPNMDLIIVKTTYTIDRGEQWIQQPSDSLYEILRFWENTMLGLSLDNFIFNKRLLISNLSNQKIDQDFIYKLLLETTKSGYLAKSNRNIATLQKNQLSAFSWFMHNQDYIEGYIELLTKQQQDKYAAHKVEALKYFDVFNIYEN